MIDQHEHQTDTTAEDRALIDVTRRFQQLLEHPFAVGFLAVAAAALLFWLSFSIGETVYRIFDGDDGAARFGLTVATAIVAIVTIAAWLGRHRHAHDNERALTAIRGFHQVLEHPFAVGFLAVALVLILFRLGIGVGETLYDAFHGNTAAAAGFGITFAISIMALIGLGAWLDRRRDARDDQS